MAQTDQNYQVKETTIRAEDWRELPAPTETEGVMVKIEDLTQWLRKHQLQIVRVDLKAIYVKVMPEPKENEEE